MNFSGRPKLLYILVFFPHYGTEWVFSLVSIKKMGNLTSNCNDLITSNYFHFFEAAILDRKKNLCFQAHDLTLKHAMISILGVFA